MSVLFIVVYDNYYNYYVKVDLLAVLCDCICTCMCDCMRPAQLVTLLFSYIKVFAAKGVVVH